MTGQEHSRLITAAAREILRPLGCFQKGRSRIWLDDRGWWIGVIEFQPSGFSKGSYLNVGAHWLWHEGPELCFDHGNRVDSFYPFESVEQFEGVAAHLANRAKDEVLALRDRFATIGAAAEVLKAADPHGSIWQNYHAGVAAALVGDTETAEDRFKLVLATRPDYAWIKQLQEQVRRRSHDFQADVARIVRRRRALYKLPEIATFEFER